MPKGEELRVGGSKGVAAGSTYPQGDGGLAGLSGSGGGEKDEDVSTQRWDGQGEGEKRLGAQREWLRGG